MVSTAFFDSINISIRLELLFVADSNPELDVFFFFSFFESAI